MEVPMRVDVIERQPGGAVGIELRGNLFFDLPPKRGKKGDLRSIDREVVAQPSAVADKAWNIGRIERRLAIDQNDVQSDSQIRRRPRSLDRVGCGGTGDHQTRGAEDAAAMRFLDGGIDRLAQPEIVRRDDQPISVRRLPPFDFAVKRPEALRQDQISHHDLPRSPSTNFPSDATR